MEEAEGLRAGWRETTTAFKLQRDTAETSDGDLNVTLMDRSKNLRKD